MCVISKFILTVFVYLYSAAELITSNGQLVAYTEGVHCYDLGSSVTLTLAIHCTCITTRAQDSIHSLFGRQKALNCRCTECQADCITVHSLEKWELASG